MTMRKQIEEFWATHFGDLTDARHQNAKAVLHEMLGTDNEKLEDKTMINELNKGIVTIPEGDK